MVDLEHVMKLKEIYTKAIEAGIQNDPRGKASVQEELNLLEKAYKKRNPGRKKSFLTLSV